LAWLPRYSEPHEQRPLSRRSIHILTQVFAPTDPINDRYDFPKLSLLLISGLGTVMLTY
jgi:hypothetical protein